MIAVILLGRIAVLCA